MLLLGLHSGYHDACAALYDEYRLVAAVALERLTRRKIDGGRVPVECIDECLAVAGATRADIGGLALSRGAFPARFYRHLPAGRALEARLRRLVGREKHKSMERECVRYRRTDSEAMFRAGDFLGALGLKPGIPLRFFNHHEAHALPTLSMRIGRASSASPPNSSSILPSRKKRWLYCTLSPPPSAV